MLQKCIRLLILPLKRFQLLYAATLLILPLQRSCNAPGRCNATNAVTATPYATNAATATGVFLLLLLLPLQHDAFCCSCCCNVSDPAPATFLGAATLLYAATLLILTLQRSRTLQRS